MKKYVYLIVILSTFSLKSFGTDADSCKIIFYRERNMNELLTSFKIYANDTLITSLKNNSYFVFNCTPRKFAFSIDRSMTTQILFTPQAGKTYYIQLILHVGLWSSTPELIKVDSTMAEKYIASGNMRKMERIRNPYFRPHNRIGLNFGFGPGFSNIAMFSTSNGTESKISFGGGMRWGLKYGYEMDKQFDISFEFNQQSSSLIPYLDNATVTFFRNFITFTPAFIISIKGGDKNRVKLGAGIDYYWGNELAISSEKIQNGFKEVFKYENKTGFHGSLNWEQNLNDNLITSIEVKYYVVDHNFKTTNGNHYPMQTSPFYMPKGDGLDFIFGFYYNF